VGNKRVDERKNVFGKIDDSYLYVPRLAKETNKSNLGSLVEYMVECNGCFNVLTLSANGGFIHLAYKMVSHLR